VLARRASAIRSPQALGSWLYGVAFKAALQARRAAARRRAAEAKARPREEAAGGAGVELREVIDQELAGLPEKYRDAVVLCDLQGKNYREAAGDLGCLEGTVASRLARGRALLARRLARHGLAPSAGLAALLSQEGASAALVASTVRAAAGQAVAAPVAAILKGVLRAMLLHKLRKVAGVLLLLALVAGGTGLVLSASQPGAEAPGDTTGGGPARTPREGVATATAQEVSWAYRQNAAYADEHFTGKRLQVTGYVNLVTAAGKPAAPDYVLVLQTEPTISRAVLPLSFEFPTEARKALAPLRPRQKVVVDGRCEGRSRTVTEDERGFPTVYFRECRLVRVDPLPPPGGKNPLLPGQSEDSPVGKSTGPLK
jgi:hypothetical protein